MMWFLYSLISGITLGTADVLSKIALKDKDEYLIVWVRLVYSLPFLLTILILAPIPILNATFYLTVALLLPLEVTATILYIKAIKLSPLSITIPFLALTPVFLIGISFLILGELPDKLGLIGILLIALGAYLLNVHTSRNGLLEPFKSILGEKGSVYMIIVAFIYSITATLGKLAVLNSDPVFFGAFYFVILTVVFTPIAINRLGNDVRKIVSFPKIFLFIGLFHGMMIVFHFLAVRLVEVAYMISVKRASLLLSSVFWGFLVFKEANIKLRFVGVLVMLMGIILITI